MRRLVVSALAGLVILMSQSGSARAAYYDGSDLQAACSSAKPDEHMGCMGYIAGILDTLSLNSTPFCVPADVGLSQIRQTFTRFATEHSEHLNRSAAEQLVISLKAAFPCP